MFYCTLCLHVFALSIGNTLWLSAISLTRSKVFKSHINAMLVHFVRLSDFIKEGSGQCKCELTQILYPTFVSIYLDLIAKGVSAVGRVNVTF